MKTASKSIFFSCALLLAACHRGPTGIAACEGAPNANAATEACTEVIDSKESPAGERARALSIRGSVKQSNGDAASAIADLDAAVALAPDDADIRANRGAIYGMQKRLDRAIPDLLAALRIDPNNTLALGNLATIYEGRNDWAHATALVDRGIQIDPKEPHMWDERCWIGAVTASDPNAALPDCNHAIELANYPNTYNSRGLAYFRAGKFAESIADYDKSLAGNPAVASSYYMRGRAKKAAGLEGAQEDIDKGLSMEPGVAERYAGYGVAAE
jgi:tetratricopeptide (TPR) repeat protein